MRMYNFRRLTSTDESVGILYVNFPNVSYIEGTDEYTYIYFCDNSEPITVKESVEEIIDLL